jgi:hypothetical protein
MVRWTSTSGNTDLSICGVGSVINEFANSIPPSSRQKSKIKGAPEALY